MPYGITQCYLPPGSSENPAFTHSQSRYLVGVDGSSLQAISHPSQLNRVNYCNGCAMVRT